MSTDPDPLTPMLEKPESPAKGAEAQVEDLFGFDGPAAAAEPTAVHAQKTEAAAPNSKAAPAAVPPADATDHVEKLLNPVVPGAGATKAAAPRLRRLATFFGIVNMFAIGFIIFRIESNNTRIAAMLESGTEGGRPRPAMDIFDILNRPAPGRPADGGTHKGDHGVAAPEEGGHESDPIIIQKPTAAPGAVPSSIHRVDPESVAARRFEQMIKRADRLFEDGSYSAARRKYYEALLVLPPGLDSVAAERTARLGIARSLAREGASDLAPIRFRKAGQAVAGGER